MEEAGGVGIGITKEFNSISVTGSTLEIDLYWSGKGTTAVPDRGVYGPLISAITVTPSKSWQNQGFFVSRQWRFPLSLFSHCHLIYFSPCRL